MDDVHEIKADLATFKLDVNAQFEGMRGDIRELTKALRDLIRIDGDIKRVQDAIARIGHQVDDHEKRLRSAEISNSGSGARLGAAERLIWIGVTFGVSALQYLVLH